MTTGPARVPITRAFLVAVIVAGTPAVAGQHVLIGVESDTFDTVTVDGAQIPGNQTADAPGILEFYGESLPAGRHTVTMRS